MAEKISTIILKADLDCRRCYKKINKTICKLQERENIQTVTFDDKNNTVTISGPFDPKKLIKKLCCKAREVIKDIQIKENKEKDKPKEETKEKTKKEETKEKTKETKEKTKKEETKGKTKEEGTNEPVPKCDCGCRLWGVGYCGYYKCPWCGRGYGWVPAGPPPPVCVYFPPYGGYKTCHIVCEEDPLFSCSVM